MGKVVGIIMAIIAWFLSSQIFYLIDKIFQISSSYKIYAVFAIGTPILLAWISYKLAPNWISQKINKHKQDAEKSIQQKPTEPNRPKKNRTQASQVPIWEPDKRDKFFHAYIPKVIDKCPLVYYYPKVIINNLDSAIFDSMVDSDDFNITVTSDSSGGAIIRKDGKDVGTIDKYGDMISDWQKRGEPMVCKIISIKRGAEAVGLGFYRDIEAKLTDYKSEIVRLTRNRSQDMQISVSLLEDGEMLDICPDYIEIEGSVPVLGKTAGEVGSLPKRFNKIAEDGGIRGVFVDHVDEDENEKYTAYVRVYCDK